LKIVAGSVLKIPLSIVLIGTVVGGDELAQLEGGILRFAHHIEGGVPDASQTGSKYLAGGSHPRYALLS
jgi:hypothetical protein